MKIEIEYEASWRNSFLDGSNNKPLPKKGRKFIASSTNLKGKDKEKSFIKKDISKDTVMGILNRLIGEQRKLYQARKNKDYYFKEIEDKVSFEDKIKVKNNEIVYLRNRNNSEDPTSFIGSVNIEHPLFKSDYSHDLWSILDIDLQELVKFILGTSPNCTTNQDNIDPFEFEKKISLLKDVKLDSNIEYQTDIINAVEYLKRDNSLNLNLKKQFPKLRKVFSDIDYIKDNKLITRAIYCSSLYLQAMRLSKEYNVEIAHLKGFSVNGFTPKDFKSLITGGKKINYGNPYIMVKKEKGEGKTISMLTKASGTLEIIIDISRDEAKDLKMRIDNAGVSSFYLGKKGLAYVTNISTKEVKKS